MKSSQEEGETRTESKRVLDTDKVWKLAVDLEEKLKFPECTVGTTLRPGVVVWSVSTKQVVIIELAVPLEKRVEKAQYRKGSKFAELQELCSRKGWRS